jgi:hypothetical protein
LLRSSYLIKISTNPILVTAFDQVTFGKETPKMTDTLIETKYFQIIGGATVLQLDGDGWTRWDVTDGLIPTKLGWDESSSQLKRISKDEATALMK